MNWSSKVDQPKPRPRQVTKPDHFLTEPHFALLEFDQYSTDDTYGGFDRHDFVRYQQFATKEAMIEYIEDLQAKTYNKLQFRCISVTPMVARTKISVDID